MSLPIVSAIALLLLLPLALWAGYAMATGAYAGLRNGALKTRSGFVVRRDKAPGAFARAVAYRAVGALLATMIASVSIVVLARIATLLLTG